MKEVVIESATYGRRIALVDDEDYELVSKFKWWVNHWIGFFYATTTIDNPRNKSGRGSCSMHRLILQPPSGLQVDHINHNGLDNRRCNLRVVTSGENHRNALKASSRNKLNERLIQKNNKSGYLVHYTISGESKQQRRWFKTLEAAKVFRDNVLTEHYQFVSNVAEKGG